jgi:hypothetical protein
MTFPQIPPALDARTVGQAELSHRHLSDERYRLARRISDDQAIEVSVLDGFLFDKMLRQKLEQRAPKFANDQNERKSADLRGLESKLRSRKSHPKSQIRLVSL